MVSSENYISNRAWLRGAVGGKTMILRNVSALEFLQLFAGYFNETDIEVYAKEKEQYENMKYRIVDTFDGIEFVRFDNVLCSSANQAINDMLSDYENTDEQALTESLSKYYYAHNNSFEGLNIKMENMGKFERIKELAVNYYCEV